MAKKIKFEEADAQKVPDDIYIGKTSTSDDSIRLDPDGKTWVIKKLIRAGRSLDLKTWEFRWFEVMVTETNIEKGYGVALRTVLRKLEQYSNDIFLAPESDTEIKREIKLLEE